MVSGGPVSLTFQAFSVAVFEVRDKFKYENYLAFPVINLSMRTN